MTTKEAKFVEAKLEGKSNTQAALAAVPNISPGYARVAGHRLIAKDNVQEALQKALKKHNITIDRIAQTISDGMDATKTVIIGKAEDAFAEQVPDTSNRLKAADMASNLMGIRQGAPKQPEPNNPQTPEQNTAIAKEIRKAMDAGDTVKLNQIILEKKDGS